MLHINTISGHERMSTRELLQKIAQAAEHGETEFQISASGQHDIGGPIWNSQGLPITMRVRNPGQRVGGMCLPGTRVIVEGPAPADVGWLNSGGEITVKGDAGDTAGHCAAGGRIYIGGRAGTRTGSLMKHDPRAGEPELWILEHTGSFSFEFMGGGRAVVCGHDSLSLSSVLGSRPGVGMVGGVIYFRGNAADLPADVALEELDGEDIAFLDKGLDTFLAALGKASLKRDLSIWKHWHKLTPATAKPARSDRRIAAFHRTRWIEGGIFGDIQPDAGELAPLAAAGGLRLRSPVWARPDACTDCRLCLKACPAAAVRRRQTEDRPVYASDNSRCIGCGICAAVCPQSVWAIEANGPE